jgi:uncharacterized protein (TIGR03083 family)
VDSDTLWGHIDAQRAALCDLLAGLDDEQWAEPSLCAGWTVRDVAAHLTFAQARLGAMLVPFVTAGLRPDVMIRRTAVASPLSREEIISTVRGFIGSRRHVATVSEREPLVDILVHGQDIAVPLGLDHPMPVEAARVALERVLQLNRRPVVRLRPPLDGYRLVATDTGWCTGRGTLVEGPTRWLLMHAAGREVAARHLHIRGGTEAVSGDQPDI